MLGAEWLTKLIAAGHTDKKGVQSKKDQVKQEKKTLRRARC